MAEVTLKIEKLEDTHAECIPVLNKLFLASGIKSLNSRKQREYWSVTAEGDHCLLNEPILSIDELGNELRAIFFITRKLKGKHTELFRFTELFSALKKDEANVSIQEAIDYFLQEKNEYIAPIAVLSLGKIEEDGKIYSGCFLYKVSIRCEPPETIVPEPTIKQVKKIRKCM